MGKGEGGGQGRGSPVCWSSSLSWMHNSISNIRSQSGVANVFCFFAFSVWTVAEPDFVFNENLQWDGASLYFCFLKQSVFMCVWWGGGFTHTTAFTWRWGMTTGVHPHLPLCLRQVLFVVDCCQHQASWPVSFLPCLPPHCRGAGITGANSLTQLLQRLWVFKVWSSCWYGQCLTHWTISPALTLFWNGDKYNGGSWWQQK